MKAKRLTASQIKKIKVLSAKGLSERAVAAKVGCSRSSVNAHKKD